MQSIPGQFIDLDGHRIHYEKVGTGPKTLLLMPGGIGTTRSDFSIQLIKDKGLSRKHFTIIAWDPPGYGFSRPPARVYSKDVYQKDADLAAKLMQELGLNYYSILGWSDGAKTALLMAIKYPSRVDKLVIWGGNAYVVQQEKRIMNTCRNTDLWNTQTKYFYLKVYGNELKELWNRHCDHYIENLDDICKNQVHNIQCPTLVLHGDLDPLPKEHPKFLTEQIADSRLYRFPKGAHNIHQEFCEEFNKVVTDFLLE